MCRNLLNCYTEHSSHDREMINIIDNIIVDFGFFLNKHKFDYVWGSYVLLLISF